MRGGSIAKRYATALIRVARERNRLEPVQKELSALAEVVAQNPRLKEALETPVITPSKKKALFAALRDKIALGEEVSNLVKVLIDQERFEVLPLLQLIFRDLSDAALGQVRVQVQSATPLGEQEVQLQTVLEKALGKKVLLEVEVRPQLIGGLAVRVGDKIFDGTLKKKLEGIKERIVRKAVA